MAEIKVVVPEGYYNVYYDNINKSWFKNETIPFVLEGLKFIAVAGFDGTNQLYDFRLEWYLNNKDGGCEKLLNISATYDKIITADTIVLGGERKKINRDGTVITGYEFDDTLTLSFIKDGVGYYIEGKEISYDEMGGVLESLLAGGINLEGVLLEEGIIESEYFN